MNQLGNVAKQICEEFNIEWDDDATEARIDGKPVSPADISRIFNTKELLDQSHE